MYDVHKAIVCSEDSGNLFSIYVHYSAQMCRVFSEKLQTLCDKTLSLSTMSVNVMLVFFNVSRKELVFP